MPQFLWSSHFAECPVFRVLRGLPPRLSEQGPETGRLRPRKLSSWWHHISVFFWGVHLQENPEAQKEWCWSYGLHICQLSVCLSFNCLLVLVLFSRLCLLATSFAFFMVLRCFICFCIVMLAFLERERHNPKSFVERNSQCQDWRVSLGGLVCAEHILKRVV